MKADEIKDAALKFFTIHGYEGASLSQIAEEVGMKKQSLYAHFKGKDDLFLQVLRDAKEAERASKLEYMSGFDKHQPERDLYGFLRLVIDLFQKNEQLKFWLRTSFFPLKTSGRCDRTGSRRHRNRNSGRTRTKIQGLDRYEGHIRRVGQNADACIPRNRRFHHAEPGVRQ